MVAFVAVDAFAKAASASSAVVVVVGLMGREKVAGNPAELARKKAEEEAEKVRMGGYQKRNASTFHECRH